jgi:CubicO group peptidase (beta-lactamase class C family)
MMIKRIIFLVLVLLLSMLLTTAWAGEAKVTSIHKAAAKGVPLNKAEKIDALIRLYAEDGYLNGAVLVAENGKIIYQKAFGLANLEWSIPNRVECKFEIYSIAKQFTSMLIMQLVEEGKVRLDGKITDYLPYYRKDTGDRITIHHLLTHSHGIPQPDWERIPLDQYYTIDEFVKTYLCGDLDFEPGKGFHYGYSGRGGISIIFRVVEDGHLVLLLNNMSLVDKRIEICHQIMEILYDQAYTTPKKFIAVAPGY